MFHVEQSIDYDRIGALITHKDIQEHILTQTYDVNKLNRDDALYYVLCHNNIDVGICVILSVNNYHFVDIGFLNCARGKIGKSLTLILKNLFFDICPNDSVYAMISKKNRRSLIFSQWIGFKIFSEDEKNYYLEVAKDGRSS